MYINIYTKIIMLQELRNIYIYTHIYTYIYIYIYIPSEPVTITANKGPAHNCSNMTE